MGLFDIFGKNKSNENSNAIYVGNEPSPTVMWNSINILIISKSIGKL